MTTGCGGDVIIAAVKRNFALIRHAVDTFVNDDDDDDEQQRESTTSPRPINI